MRHSINTTYVELKTTKGEFRIMAITNKTQGMKDPAKAGTTSKAATNCANAKASNSANTSKATTSKTNAAKTTNKAPTNATVSKTNAKATTTNKNIK